MNRWRYFFPGLLLLTLCACSAQQGGGQTVVSKGSAAGKLAPSTDIPALACAEVDQTDGVTIRYQAEQLYHRGAVLPREQGLACLEELTQWLKSVPQSRWQITSSGEEGVGFDPQALAEKRQELLQRFFARRGIEVQSLEWQATAGLGAQLQLRLVEN